MCVLVCWCVGVLVRCREANNHVVLIECVCVCSVYVCVCLCVCLCVLVCWCVGVLPRSYEKSVDNTGVKRCLV